MDAAKWGWAAALSTDDSKNFGFDTVILTLIVGPP